MAQAPCVLPLLHISQQTSFGSVEIHEYVLVISDKRQQMAPPRFLVVVFPGQGHINPALQLSKHLRRHGALVTFSTSISAYRRMNKSSIPQELAFVNFSDGNDDGENVKLDSNFELYMSELERRGSETLREQIMASINEGRSFSCVIYTTVIPWVADVARSLRIPSVLLWAQPAAVLDIYYYNFNGYGDAIKSTNDDPLSPVELPGIPQLIYHNLPFFVQPGNKFVYADPLLEKHIVNIKEEPKVLVNTFDALEPEALKAINKLDLVAIGPLTPPALLDGQYPSHITYGGDLFEGCREYIDWLNTKAEGCVIYVSFGSINMLPKQQMEEIARGLLDTGRPFLWVIRNQAMEDDEDKGQLSCKEELDKQGMIISWCPQEEVLSHPSIGCFVTHCGWNSTLESLVCGIPIVTIPQWADQPTNAKLVEDLWKTGIQPAKNDEGIVESSEIKKCLELIMGGSAKGEDMRNNAKKWKELAREAGRTGGDLDKNLKAFIEGFVETPN